MLKNSISGTQISVKCVFPRYCSFIFSLRYYGYYGIFELHRCSLEKGIFISQRWSKDWSIIRKIRNRYLLYLSEQLVSMEIEYLWRMNEWRTHICIHKKICFITTTKDYIIFATTHFINMEVLRINYALYWNFISV